MIRKPVEISTADISTENLLLYYTRKDEINLLASKYNECFDFLAHVNLGSLLIYFIRSFPFPVH